jgi:hypothetical protein
VRCGAELQPACRRLAPNHKSVKLNATIKKSHDRKCVTFTSPTNFIRLCFCGIRWMYKIVPRTYPIAEIDPDVGNFANFQPFQ